MPKIETVKNDTTDPTIILSLELGKVVNKRIIASDTDAVETEIDRSMLHISIDLFDAKELKECQNFQARLKSRIKKYSVPSFFRGGMYRVKLEALDIIDKLLEEAVVEFQPLVHAFAEVVDERRDESKERLGPAFDADMYPDEEEIKKKYRIDWRWLTLETPSSMKKVSSAIYAKEQKKAEAAYKEATDGVTIMLAAEAKKLGDHLIERLTPAEEGKPKQIRNSAVDNIKEFLSTFSFRNIGSSDELNAQIERIKGLVSGLDAKDLRDSEILRTDIAKSFTEVTLALDALIVEKPKRFMAKG